MPKNTIETIKEEAPYKAMFLTPLGTILLVLIFLAILSVYLGTGSLIMLFLFMIFGAYATGLAGCFLFCLPVYFFLEKNNLPKLPIYLLTGFAGWAILFGGFIAFNNYIDMTPFPWEIFLLGILGSLNGLVFWFLSTKFRKKFSKGN